jgi:hypothetical protein
MGSFCDLRIAGYSVIEQKYRIDPELLCIFVETEKVHAVRAPDRQRCEGDEDDENGDFDGYCNTAGAIAERLDLMGFTPEAARADFDLTRLSELQEKRDLNAAWTGNDGIPPTFRERSEREIEFLSHLTFEAWLAAMRRVREDDVCWKDYDVESRNQVFSRKLDEIEAHILNERNEDESPILGYYCSDFRFLIRASLLCAKPMDLVVLDCSEMVNAGYFEAAEPIVQNARALAAAGARAVEKILVLTEGRSDTHLLRETLDVLYPHLKEFLSFLDYDQFAVAGGAGNLLNLLRGFAGAGVSNRVLALFDNDAAGTVEIRKARAMTLPSNFRVLQLPNITRGEAYPTFGPTGLTEANINGLACSIELYLGKSALTDQSGSLVPVQWRGYERSLSRYQGELVEKKSVQDRYFELLRAGQADTSDLDLVFRQLFQAFHR